MMYKVYDVVGEYAITADGGEEIYNKIHPELLAGKTVNLDFTGVKIFASPFFNFAIGQLLKDISADNLNQLLKITNISPHGQNVLKRIIDNAKRYYSDDKFRNALDSAITDMAETN